MPTCRPYGGTNVPLPSGTWSLGDTPTGGRLGGGVRLPVGGLEREEPVRQVDTEAKGSSADAAPNGRASVELAIISSPFHPLP